MPALAVRGPKLRWALRRVTLAWCFGVVWLVVVQGPHKDKLTRMVGFNDFTRGLLASAMYAGALLQLVASLLIERTGLTKFQFYWFALLHRVLWIPVGLALLLLPTPTTFAAICVLVLISMSWAADGFAHPAWITWMGYLIPPRIRGRYMGHRRVWSTMVHIPVAVSVGLAVWLIEDPDPDAKMTVAAQPLLAQFLAWMLVVGGVSGIIDILLFRRIPEVVPPERTVLPALPEWTGSWLAHLAKRFWRGLHWLALDPMANRDFRKYVMFRTTLTFAQTVAAGYFVWNIFENLHMNALHATMLWMVAPPLAWVTIARPLGRAIDQWGRKPIFTLGAIGTLFSISPWLFIYPGMPPAAFYILSALPFVIGGIVWGAVQQAEYNMMLSFADGAGRSRYVAASRFYISTGGILGGVVGGALTHSLAFMQAEPLMIGPFLYNNWHVAFAASLLFRALSLVFLIGMHDPGATSVRHAARQVGAGVTNAVIGGLLLPMRALPWRRMKQDNPYEDER
ncbi:MAG: MFS transporter [Planctomycetota bacterium]